MEKELQLKLVEKYPVIFQDYGGDPRQTCMAWGIDCGDGWYDLIDKLCKEIEELIRGTNTQVVAQQVKEKFGGLRFYFVTLNSAENEDICRKIEDAVNAAEEKSYKICEYCGELGKIWPGHFWMQTLCEKCEDDRNKPEVTS